MTPPLAKRSEQDVVQRRMQLLNSVALRHSVAALDGFTRRLGSALAQASLQALDGVQAAALQRAAERLSREGASFQRLFSDCLQQALEREVKTLLARPRSRLRRDALDLSLGSFEAMQRKVETDNLAQAYDRANADALSALRQRMANWLGREPAGLINPFRAEVFLHAAVTAWERFEADATAQSVLLRQLGPDCFLPLDDVLAAVRQELDRQLPPNEAAVPTAPAPRANGLLQIERRVLSRPDRVLDAAFDHLMQARSLPEHTIDILSCLRPGLRALAQGDGRFLINARHPGRRLAQLAIQASLAAGAHTPGASALQALASRIGARLEQDQSSEALEKACKEVEGHLAPLLQSVTDKRNDCIAEATRQEREARAEQLARREVVVRLEPGTVPAFVEAFLLEHWVRVLAFAQTVHASKPALLPNLVQAMDDLIWSVQPKPGPADRRELQERLPAILSLLNAWLNVVKWDGPPRNAFMERLAQRHAQLMRAAPEPSARELLEAHMDTIQRVSEQDLIELENEQEEEALLPYMHRIDALVPGDWAQFVRNDGSTVQCRLAWVSAARSRFVFVAPSAQMAFIISENLFAQGLRAGRARITATGEVLQAALTAAAASI